MTGPRAVRATAIAGAAALALSLPSCALPLPTRPPTASAVTAPAPRRSVLVVVTDQDSAAAMKAAAALVTATAHTGERVLVLSDRDGAVLATSQAPPSPIIRVGTAPPPSLPDHPTSFQQASYARAMQRYEAALRQARAVLAQHQRAGLSAWARAVMAAATGTGTQDGQKQADEEPNADTGLEAAATTLSSLRQAGTGASTPVVIAVVGVSQAAARSVPVLATGLLACTVVLDDFAGGSSEEAAWQEALLQAGATRATLLVPATDSQFASVVGEGLDGAVTDTLTSVLFGPGQSSLSRSAVPQLQRLLQLLTVKYPQATAVIDGYTDDLPVTGGNLRLSQLRAEAVRNWLIAQGVAPGRLDAFGYGATDPIAPNTPGGQPLNRRVVAVIDPALA
jgi:outer membrane protein OmpA-like peptidoglycan-associated protein